MKPGPFPSPRLPDGYPIVGFPGVVRAAGMIFSGTVRRVERRPDFGGQAIESIAVTFHIENAIRGVKKDEDLTIVQWSGLWSSGQRYRVGERILLFLYPRSKLGLTSWVGGSIGHFDVDASNRVLLSSQQSSALRTHPVLGEKPHPTVSDFVQAVRAAAERE